MSLMERFRPAGRLQQYGQGSRRLGGWEEDGGNRAWCTTKLSVPRCPSREAVVAHELGVRDFGQRLLRPCVGVHWLTNTLPKDSFVGSGCARASEVSAGE